MAVTVHDWTLVDAGTFHDFHNSWVVFLKTALNQGVLPPEYYAQTEQHMNRFEADVLTLHRPTTPRSGNGAPRPAVPPPTTGAVAVEDAPPKAAVRLSVPAHRPRTVAVRHTSGNQIVALIEIVSLSNKDRPAHVADFVGKVEAALDNGVHVVILDVLPAGKHDPNGMPGAVWSAVGGTGFALPEGKPLTLASLVASTGVDLYADYLAVGDPIPEVSLFLTPRYYVPLPLGPTYRSAFASVPEVWRQVLETPPT